MPGSRLEDYVDGTTGRAFGRSGGGGFHTGHMGRQASYRLPRSGAKRPAMNVSMSGLSNGVRSMLAVSSQV